MKQEIAQRLAARRKRAGLSQESLAEQLGVSRQAVSKWECGECAPDTENLIALAVLYDVSLDDLLWKDLELEGEEAAAVDATGDAGRASKGASAAERPESGAASAHGAERAGRHGESVHVSWRDGVHVIDPVKGEEVHVGWDGIRVKAAGAVGEGAGVGGGVGDDARAASGDGGAPGADAARAQSDWFAARDGSGHTFETDGSTVVVDGVRYDSWRDAHRAHGHRRDDGGRLWRRFPVPLLVIVAFVFVGVFTGLWIPAVFLFFLIPLYYLVGNLVETRGVARFVEAAYPIGSLAFFCYMTLIEGVPHPAWLVFLTIPLVECACVACSRWWKGRCRADA